ncbi:hypothetical protein ID866_5032 [Astraeus odoratus]|nr:hypothetical protein ID866_5032 [Astraeus odoratus]
MSETTATGVKIKTKAKKRYLKRKKLRRNARRAAAPKAKDVTTSGPPEDDTDIDVSEDEILDADKSNVTVFAGDAPQKKKRKRSDEGSDVEGDTVPQAEELDIPVESELPPRGTLHAFPAPAAPDAPSKSVLAMQGVDKASIHADIVEPSTVLPILPSGEDRRTGISEKTRRRLLELGITELFAVQTAILPFILSPTDEIHTCIAQVLSSRVVTRLRALVVLPTRDLVSQVRETFEAVGKGRGLKIGTATGQHSFTHEQNQLVSESSTTLKGGSSKVDILICTPGRLMDHLNGTPNFTLQHLRFLVIDEADRLLAQSFHDWLAQVLAACDPRRHRADSTIVSLPSWDDSHGIPMCDSLSPAFLQMHLDWRTDVDEPKESSCQKLLFSATLTQDPGKLASLGLRDPKYFIVRGRPESNDEGIGAVDLVSERFTMPATLTEHMIVCEPSVKPLVLLYLFHHHSIHNALVFTKSSESTSRLVRLVDFFQEAGTEFEHIVVRAYSSDLPAGERKSILEKFKAREVHILVCSDLISRGVDISHVSHVISYDAPVDMRKYVHRVGRTARAGRTGDAWTLVEEQEARYFKGMLREYDHLEQIKRTKVSHKDTSRYLTAYQIALQKLKEVYVR